MWTKCATKFHLTWFQWTSVWDSLTKKVHAGRTEKFKEQALKDKIKEKRDEISVAEIRKYTASWKKTIRLVDSKNGGHVDHLIDLSRGK